MRTEAPSPDVRIADRPCGLHRRFGYRRFLVSPVRPIAGFVLEALSLEFPSPEPHIAGRSIAGRFLMCYRWVSKSGDEIRRYRRPLTRFRPNFTTKPALKKASTKTAVKFPMSAERHEGEKNAMRPEPRAGPEPEREFFLFDGPGGAMGIGFLGGRWNLFFARQRKKKIGVFFVFFGVFVVVFWGCFLGVFFGVFFCFSR